MDAQKNDVTQILTFSLGDQLFGINVLSVQDVLGAQKITNVTVADDAVAGVLNLRGRIVTVVDVRKPLHVNPDHNRADFMNIVVEHKGELFSLQIDSVGDVLSLNCVDLDDPPATMDHVWKNVSSGIYKLDGKLLVVLDIGMLLNAIGRSDKKQAI
ncbi:MAG: chemotaxis protein CheW [Micavibrio aeruginosavorus]|uniref:Chemotaxis protein CheW n=1 Tax=Micavibrio aeruginosavorus TaxID=349221 RepID=A0A7T5R223_9BACT|nr:MAG: chemotaxis protein CheW [Micavibrio aeruginosavorus]